jgi:hypothetical protein
MLPWLFEAARPETTFCASYACPDLRKLISDTVSTAGGTDRIQVQADVWRCFTCPIARSSQSQSAIRAKAGVVLGYSQYHLR